MCRAYDRVKIEAINDLRRNSSRLSYTKKIEERVRENTQNWFNAFMIRWNQYQAHCLYPGSSTRTCLDQAPHIFQLNEVSLYSAYTEHILRIPRPGMLDVLARPIPIHGIIPRLYLLRQHGSILTILRLFWDLGYKISNGNVPILTR